MGEANSWKLAGTTNADCPCCNVRKIFVQALQHCDEIRTSNGRPVVFKADADHLIVDFGIVQIHAFDGGHRLTVTNFGDEVLKMSSPEGFDILREGQWIGTLVAIEAYLAERFGPVILGADQRLH